jgi:hypothetical protein
MAQEFAATTANPFRRRFRFGVRSMFLFVALWAASFSGVRWFANVGTKWHCLNPQISGPLDRDEAAKIVRAIRADERFSQVSVRSIDAEDQLSARVTIVEYKWPHHDVFVDLQCESGAWTVTRARNFHAIHAALSAGVLILALAWQVVAIKGVRL